MSKQSFKSAYRIARRNRHSLHLRGEFFSFGEGSVFVGSTGDLTIGRDGVYGSQQPAFWVGLMCQGMGSVAGTRYLLDNSRMCNRVPLP